MSPMTRFPVFPLLVACSGSKPSPEPSTVPSAATERPTTPAVQQPPPPPPPPSRIQPQPPPDSVTKFLEGHEADTSPWEVFVYEITATRGGKEPRFLGHTIIKRHAASAADATELAQRLGRDASYVNGDYGCVGDPIGITLGRSSARLDMLVDCGHLSFGDDGGHAAMLSRDMIAFVNRLRAAK